jgi:acyl-CoA thioester hydrolase
MLDFKRQVDLRWSDLDPNFHLRHSVYYDFGAKLRMDYILSQGIPMASFQHRSFWPYFISRRMYVPKGSKIWRCDFYVGESS